MRILFFLFSSFLFFSASAQSKLQSGPMLGYVEMREALIWLQTTESASVTVEYWDSVDASTKWMTDPIQTEKKSGFTAKCIAENLEPGVKYAYLPYIDGKAVDLDFPTFLQANPFGNGVRIHLSLALFLAHAPTSMKSNMTVQISHTARNTKSTKASQQKNQTS